MRSAILVVTILTILAIAGTTSFAQNPPGGAEARLKARNIVLPALPKPVGNYVEAVRVGNLLFWRGMDLATNGEEEAR